MGVLIGAHRHVNCFDKRFKCSKVNMLQEQQHQRNKQQLWNPFKKTCKKQKDQTRIKY